MITKPFKINGLENNIIKKVIENIWNLKKKVVSSNYKNRII